MIPVITNSSVVKNTKYLFFNEKESSRRRILFMLKLWELAEDAMTKIDRRRDRWITHGMPHSMDAAGYKSAWKELLIIQAIWARSGGGEMMSG